MVRLSGVLDYSMGGFLCLRGFASYKLLNGISQPNPEVQRDLIEAHKGEMAAFLNKGEYRFFPELILSLSLTDGRSEIDKWDEMHTALQKGYTWNKGINGIQFSISQNKTKSVSNRYAATPPNTIINLAHLTFDEDEHPLTRIDGNHRLSAADKVESDFKTPFCLLLFQDPEKNDQFSRAIFHNINSKQLPLTMEENIKVILTSPTVFPDTTLQNDPTFGWEYYLARKSIYEIDLSYFRSINELIGKTPHSFYVDLYRNLIKSGSVEKNESAFEKVKAELTEVAHALVESRIADTTKNLAVIGALAFYKINNPSKYRGFLTWVKINNIGNVEGLHTSDVIRLYDEIYQHVPKKVFLARWYPNPKEDDNQEVQKAKFRVDAMKAVASALNLDLIDLGTQKTGTFDIREVMRRNIRECDIFIADLSGARHNVMIEVGYALQHVDTGRMLFYFQESSDCKKVPFDVEHLNYVSIQDSSQIGNDVKERVRTILEQAESGRI